MKRKIFIVLFLISSSLFADPITITEDGMTFSIELINTERAQRLKDLYESRYNYVYIMDSIEFEARFWEENSTENDSNDDFADFRKQIENIKKGEHKVATISMSSKDFLLLGLIYFGHDYFFMVLFTNTYDSEFINLRIDKVRYNTIFKNSWNMLIE